MWEELINAIGNWFWLLIQRIVWIWNIISEFFSQLISVFKVIFYGLVSLLSSVGDLLQQVFVWGIFNYLVEAFAFISEYIWWTATMFLFTILFVAIIRFIIWFVFRIFKLSL